MRCSSRFVLPPPASVMGSGSGSGSVQPITWTEVSTSAELATALATGGANILLSASFSVTAAIAASAGRYLIAKNDGVQVSFTGNGQITAASAGTVFVWHFSCWDRVAPTLIINNTGAFGLSFQNTANIQHEGFLSVDSTINAAYQPSFGNNRHNMMALSVRTNAASFTLGTGSIELVDAQATAGTPYLYVKTSCSRILMRGDWRPDDGASAASSTCSLFIASGGFQNTTTIGSVEFVDPTSNPCVAVTATSGPARVDSISCYVSGVTPRVGLTGQASLGASYVSPIFGANGATNFAPVFEDCYLINPRWVSANGAIMRNCKVSALATFPSGSYPQFYSCRLVGSTITFASGSGPLLDNCAIDSAVVLSSGAAARITKLQSAAGTLTNNDPLSVVTESADVRHDTTPATRGFADSSGAQSATLNSELLPHVLGYWDGNSMPGRNRGPGVPGCVGGTIHTRAGAVISSGGKIEIDAITDAADASLNWYPGSGDYTISIYVTATDATPAAERNVIVFAGASTSIDINLLATGALRVYANGAGSFGTTTGTGLLSDAVESRISVVRRVNAGTNTVYIYVDGIEVGAFTGLTLGLNPVTRASLGGGSNIALIGQFRRILAASVGISEATENLLDTYWLQGAGNA